MIGQGYTVLGDLYSISSKIKEIDEGYFLFYRYKTGKYEVHNARQRGSSLSLVCPYPVLDDRLLRLVRKTRVERCEELFREMEKENELIEKKQFENLVKRKEFETEALIRQYEKEEKKWEK